MDRRRYFSKPNVATVHITPSPNNDDDWWLHQYSGAKNETLATEVIEDYLPDSYDTGLLDAKGDPIHRSLYRNGIGFTATIMED